MSSAKSTTAWDAIVIGAGLGGLSSAACLAAAGKRTLLLERYAVLGGSSHVFRRGKDWEFDCGVHYLGACRPTDAIPTLMRGLGLDDRIEWLPLDPQGFDTIVGPDFELDVPVGWDHYLDALIQAFPRKEERKLRFYVKVMRRIGEGVDRSSLEVGQGSTLARSAAAGRRLGWAAPYALMPHAAFLAMCGFDPKTLLALSVQDGALASSPLELPVFMAAGFLQDYVGGGAWYPKGGGQMLSAGFADVIHSHGGEIRTNTQVGRIMVSGGKVTGVRLQDGQELSAPVVVAAGDIKRTYEELVGFEHLAAGTVKRVRSMKMTMPLINAFFKVEMDGRQTPNSNYFVIPNWDEARSLIALQRMSRRLLKPSGRNPLDWARDYVANQPAYVQCSTRRDPDNRRSAPPGHAAVEVQSIAPYDPALWGFDGYDIASGAYRESRQYQEIKRIITDGFADRAGKAYPAAQGHIHAAELGTPASQTRFTHTSAGSAFGLRPNLRQGGPFRPGTRTEIHGLLLAGASTAWGPGTVGAMLSGLHAASIATERDLLQEMREGAVIAHHTPLRKWADDFDPLLASRGSRQAIRARARKHSTASA